MCGTPSGWVIAVTIVTAIAGLLIVEVSDRWIRWARRRRNRMKDEIL